MKLSKICDRCDPGSFQSPKPRYVQLVTKVVGWQKRLRWKSGATFLIWILLLGAFNNCVDSFYTLGGDKNRNFWPRPPNYQMTSIDTYQSRQTGCCNCFSVTLLTHGTLWSSIKGHKSENQDETTQRYVWNGMTRNEHTVLVLETIDARPEDNCAWKKATSFI